MITNIRTAINSHIDIVLFDNKLLYEMVAQTFKSFNNHFPTPKTDRRSA